MTRTNAREIAVHVIYNLYCTDQPVDELIASRLDEEYFPILRTDADAAGVYTELPDEKQLSYIQTLTRGVQQQREELDAVIERLAVGWSLKRISAIARAILEVALFEIRSVEDVPTSVAINEAVELSKKYVEADTSSFINGILGSYAKEVGDHVSGD